MWGKRTCAVSPCGAGIVRLQSPRGTEVPGVIRAGFAKVQKYRSAASDSVERECQALGSGMAVAHVLAGALKTLTKNLSVCHAQRVTLQQLIPELEVASKR
jgi:hypothetical protein